MGRICRMNSIAPTMSRRAIRFLDVVRGVGRWGWLAHSRRTLFGRTRGSTGSGPGIDLTVTWYAYISMINGFRCRQDGHETTRTVTRSLLAEGILGAPYSY